MPFSFAGFKKYVKKVQYVEQPIAGNKNEFHFEKRNLILNYYKTWGFVLSSVLRKKKWGEPVEKRGGEEAFIFSFLFFS